MKASAMITGMILVFIIVMAEVMNAEALVESRLPPLKLKDICAMALNGTKLAAKLPIFNKFFFI